MADSTPARQIKCRYGHSQGMGACCRKTEWQTADAVSLSIKGIGAL